MVNTASGKTSPDDRHNLPTDPFWRAVRAHLAFRDDESVHREWAVKLTLFKIAPRITPMRLVIEQAESLIRTKGNVVIQGPPGSPRLEIARIIHDATRETSGEPCLCNCAGAKSSTASTILARAGRLKTTLIVQHLDKAETALQRTLLAFLDDEKNRAGVRCIGTATNDLAELAAAGTFDSDLLTCLNYDRRIVVPPLKDHPWDIVPNVVSRVLHDSVPGEIRQISYAALVFFREYNWPRDLQQLNELVDGLCREAIESGDTTLRLEQIIEWFRHVVPPYDLVREAQDEDTRVHKWQARLGSEETARLFVEHFRTPDKRATPEMGGWDTFAKREGYCPLLFAADIGADTLTCNLRLRPLYACRRWLASEKNPHRRGWQKLLAEAEKDQTCEVTVESADTEILFDLRKMTDDLWPFLQEMPPERKGDGSLRIHASEARTRNGSTLPKRRYIKRDWRIHDEVRHCYRRAGFSTISKVCEEVAAKWENISARRVKNIYYELAKETRPPKCIPPRTTGLDSRYPQYARPEMG
jgi:hypothetical protein